MDVREYERGCERVTSSMVRRALDCALPSAMGASPAVCERCRFEGVIDGVTGGFFDSSERPDPEESCHISK